MRGTYGKLGCYYRARAMKSHRTGPGNVSPGSPSPPAGPDHATVNDERWAIVERIAASRHFRKANRLRDLLFYLCARSLEDPGAKIHEHEIGCKVYGRSPDFQSSEDTIVRVQVSQLRLRLEHYFSTDGMDESLMVSIPSGGYNVTWKPKPSPRLAPAPPVVAEPAARARPVRLPLAILCGSLALLCIVLGARDFRLRQPTETDMPPDGALFRFWRHFAGKDRRLAIVMGDGNLGLWSELNGRNLTLAEYLGRAYAARPSAEARQREAAMMSTIMGRNFTNFSEALVVSRFMRLAPRSSQPVLMFAREMTGHQFDLDDVILLGSKRSNPWSELFEDELSFRLDNDKAGKQKHVQNVSPRASEPARFESSNADAGLCVIAFLQNLNADGKVMIIAGTDGPSTEAGGAFLTTEESMSRLLRTLGAGPGGAFPYFQIVLRTRKAGPSGTVSEIAAYRAEFTQRPVRTLKTR